MEDVRGAAEVSAELSEDGEASELKLEAFVGVGGADLSDCRRTTRKSLRSSLAKGRRGKSSPKSPLMRMAEMRKGGLREKALRQSGKKGLGGPGSKVDKGLKGVGRKDAEMLSAIPENSEIGEDSALVVFGEEEVLTGISSSEGASEDVDVEEEGAAGVGGVVGVSGGMVPEVLKVLGSPDRGREGDCSKLAGQSEAVLVGLQSDFALDLISAQPLQEMAFVCKQASPLVEENVGKDCHMLEMGSEEFYGRKMNEEFPPLSKDNFSAC